MLQRGTPQGHQTQTPTGVPAKPAHSLTRIKG